MNDPRNGGALPEEEISIGIEKVLRDYSIESVLGQLSQVNVGSASFAPLVEPLTDLHVAHRRDVVNDEYSQFLDAIQSSSYHHKDLVGKRSERQHNTPPQSTQTHQINQLSPSSDTVISRPELDPIAHLQQHPNLVVNNYMLLQGGIQLIQDDNQKANEALGTRKELTLITEVNDSSLHIGDLPLNNMRRSQMTFATSLDKLERYHTSVNSRSDVRPVSPEWLSEAASFARNTSQAIRDMAYNRSERVSFASDEKLLSPSVERARAQAESEPIPVRLSPPQSSQRLSSPIDAKPKTERLTPQDVPFYATRAYVNLKTKEITVVKPGEQSITCKLEVNSQRPTPVGHYLIRPQGQEQISTYNLRAWVSPLASAAKGDFSGFGNYKAIISEATKGKYFPEALRSQWYLLEPQFDTNSTRVQIHAGRYSLGCLTIIDKQCFSNIAGLLNSSVSFTGYGTNGQATRNNPGTIVSGIGLVSVDNNEYQGEVIRVNTTYHLMRERSEYGLKVSINGEPKPERSRFGLGINKSYDNLNSGGNISNSSQHRNYNLGVRLPESPSKGPSQDTPELLRGNNQPKQSAPSKPENQKSSSSGSHDNDGPDKGGADKGGADKGVADSGGGGGGLGGRRI